MRVIIALGAAGVMLGGCATVVRGTTEQVTITAEPPHAAIRTSLGHHCPASPCVVTVDRKLAFDAYAEAPGYQPGSIAITTQMSGGGAAGMAGNVLVGGVIGIGVDAVTGATLDHVPNPAHIALAPVHRAEPPPPVVPRPKKQPVVRPRTPIS